MLVLSRKNGEQICIGENIVVKVVGIHGNRVKLGIEAPREVRVVRVDCVEVRASGCKVCGQPLMREAERATGVCGDCAKGES